MKHLLPASSFSLFPPLDFFISGAATGQPPKKKIESESEDYKTKEKATYYSTVELPDKASLWYLKKNVVFATEHQLYYRISEFHCTIHGGRE